jgi:ATP-dependent RNA helicase DDX49/DBP8
VPRLVSDCDKALEAMHIGVSVQVIPSKRQTLLFTATMTEPLSALRAANLENPCIFQQHEGLQTADNIQERYLLVPAKVKEVYLVHVLQRMEELLARNAIVFCSKRGSCEIVSGLLFQLGFEAVSLHSGKPQKARLAALHKVCTPSIIGPTISALIIKSLGISFSVGRRLETC